MPRIDLHQHLWPPEFLQALRARPTNPRLADWTLHLDGEPPFQVSPQDHDPAHRAALARHDRIDLVGVGLSSPLGIEELPPDQGHALLNAWHTGARAMKPPFAHWVSIGLTEIDLLELAENLAQPTALGLQLPATALATPQAVARLAPALAVCADADAPVLIHPGPAVAGTQPGGIDLPAWWPALADYPAQLAAAWFAWHASAADRPDGVRIAFVALAGLAPLHLERLAQRGGRFHVDPHVFYETSSYGTRAIDAMVRVVGVDQIVHGSDRPYAEPADPGLGEAMRRLTLSTNSLRLIGSTRRALTEGTVTP